MNTKSKAVISLAIVAFGYVLLNIAARLMNEGLEPMTQVYLRIGIGFVLSLLIFKKKLSWKNIYSTSKKDWLILGIMGTVAYSIAVYFITIGAIKASLLNVSIIYSTIGFFVYFYSLLFLKSKFDPKSLFLVFTTFIGLVFISGKSFVPKLDGFGIGEIYVLVSAALMGGFSIGRKLLSKQLNNQEITTVVMLIAFISGLLIAIVKGESFPTVAAFTVPVIVGLLIGAVLNILVNYLENYAFEHIDVVLGNQILLIESLFSLVIGVLFYKEIISFPEVVGALTILISVYWSNKIL